MKASLFTILSVGLGIWGDVLFKQSRGFPWIPMLIYGLSGIPIWFAYKTGAWMQVGILYQALAIILAIGFGSLLFQEAITMRKIMGFFLALVAGYLAMDN